MTTSVAVPVAAFLIRLGVKACGNYYQLVAALVGWPHL